MKYIFVDNFRGFTRTLLSIRDVNFFVGENSTGKTSLLGLIKLLDTPHFWFNQEFNTNEVRLGNFMDIVSVNSPDKGYFRIGFVDSIPRQTRKETPTFQAFLLTFMEEEGVPIVSQYTFISGGEQIKVNFSAKMIKFKNEGPCEVRDDSEFIKRMLLSWVDSHEKIDTGYETLKMPVERREALLFIPSMLEDILRRRRRGRTTTRGVPLYIERPFRSVAWLAPIRTRPQRTYDSYTLDYSPTGDHTPYLIKKFLARRTQEQRKQADKFIRFIEKFGKDSGLFKSIAIKDYDRRTTTSPFELDIILTKEALSIDNVGYGVSQSLPIIVELFARPKDTWFAIQQPEIHIHPRAQTALGDIVFELALAENKKFIIETHSDFAIDGFRLNYRRQSVRRKPDAQVVFFERNPRGNVLYEMKILENGELPDTQPPAYREFFVKEQMRLLGF